MGEFLAYSIASILCMYVECAFYYSMLTKLHFEICTYVCIIIIKIIYTVPTLFKCHSVDFLCTLGSYS